MLSPINELYDVLSILKVLGAIAQSTYPSAPRNKSDRINITNQLVALSYLMKAIASSQFRFI